MARLCERPGCSQPAEVIYGIDADHLVVWIEPLDGTIGYRAGVLCRRHADAMVVPLGWMLDDRREPVPRLFKPRDSAVPRPAKARRHRSASGRDDTGQLELPTMNTRAPSHATADDPHAPSAPTAVAEPITEVLDPDGTSPWRPVFDQTDDLDGLLVARSPLLSRAFGKRERPGAS